MNIWTRLLLALALGIVVTVIATTSLIQDFEVSTCDLFFRLRGVKQPPDDIVIITLDEMSYADLKVPLDKQAWPRALHAQLLEKLASYQVKQVVFDILFLDPGADPAVDEQLANAMSKVPTILGADSALQQVSGPGGSYFLEELLRPYTVFGKKAAAEGLVAMPDDDGTIRRFLASKTERSKFIPSLAEATAGISPTDPRKRPGPRDLINYYGPGRTIPTVSYYQIIRDDSTFFKNLLKGKTVMVGLLLRSETGPAQKDVFTSPYRGSRIFGVEVHATAALNLMHQSWITRLDPLPEAAIQGTAATVFGILAFTVAPPVLALCAIATAIAWIVAAYFLWASGFFFAGAFFVVVVLPASLLLSSIYFYLVVKKKEESIRSAFELYVSPEMVPKLGNASQSLKLGGEKLWVTALFTDIQDFTTIAENMPAEKTSEMLNAYFTEVMDVIFQNQGTLLKFIGDAVFALWGAPLKAPNHAELAIRTALAIQVGVERFNSSGRFPALHTRIGIHTGPMLVGNLGSNRRLDYTAIGDSVNLASRVEGLNKFFGTKVLFTEATKKDAAGSIPSVLIAAARVRGKREVVELYTVFEPVLEPDILARWNSALALFRQREFLKAKDVFQELSLREKRLEAPSLCYIKQCEILQNATVPQGWDGEIEFDSK